MTLSHSKHDLARLLGKRFLTIGLLALLVLAASASWSAYQKARESRVLRTHAEMELSELSTREVALSADIAKLTTNRGKEETLREQYPLAGQGEGLIIIVDQETMPAASAGPSLLDWFERTLQWW